MSMKDIEQIFERDPFRSVKKSPFLEYERFENKELTPAQFTSEAHTLYKVTYQLAHAPFSTLIARAPDLKRTHLANVISTVSTSRRKKYISDEELQGFASRTNTELEEIAPPTAIQFFLSSHHKFASQAVADVSLFTPSYESMRQGLIILLHAIVPCKIHLMVDWTLERTSTNPLTQLPLIEYSETTTTLDNNKSLEMMASTQDRVGNAVPAAVDVGVTREIMTEDQRSRVVDLVLDVRLVVQDVESTTPFPSRVRSLTLTMMMVPALSGLSSSPASHRS